MKSRHVVVFSSLGHLYVHLCTAFYFVIVLALEVDWQLPYHRLIELWTLGSLLVGAAALPAGLLGDRIGAARMMAVYFIGLGLSSIAAGLSTSPLILMLALTGIGGFAAIYHPVGIPWLVRNGGAERGKVLGFNGIFGSLGAAGAGLTAGFLIDAFSWRAAFIAPGLLCCATGVVFLGAMARGRIPDAEPPLDSGSAPSRQDMARAFTILLLTMFLGGMVYHTTQTGLPKVFAERHGGLVGDGTLGVGLLVAGVYTIAGLMQIIGGHLADRFSLKSVYLGALFLQIPMLWMAASLGGAPLMFVVTVMVMGNVGMLPAENMLLAKYTPGHRHGVAFGLKFALGFGAAPLSVLFVSRVSERTGSFYWVFVGLAFCAALAFAVAILLPPARRESVVPNIVPDRVY